MTKAISPACRTAAGRKCGIGDAEVEHRAMRELARDCQCAYYFRAIRVEYKCGVLTAGGRVPTYALKSLLETILSQVDGVEEVDSQVDVVSATGLSSVHPK